MIAPVDERDLHGCVVERFRRLQPAEATADDDDPSAGAGIGRTGGRLRRNRNGSGIMGLASDDMLRRDQ